MTWKATNPMEQKKMFIQAWLTQQYSKTQLCQQFGISRPTGDKWLARYHQNGLAGLHELSRAPKHHANAIAPEICELLVQAKLQKPHWGAKKLLAWLRQNHPNITLPADSTGDLILKRAGLVQPRKRRRQMSADNSPFTNCDAPNQSWSVDFKGDFLMGNQKRCYPLTISDNYSRQVLLCQALGSTAHTGVQPMFERVFTEYGLPYSIRSDNGIPFASQSLGGLSRLSKWWIDLGIRPERINLGHPEQNGRHERMHRTLKDYLQQLNKIAANLSRQQIYFDEFIQEYNRERMHEGLDGLTPETLYQPSVRPYSNIILPYEYDSHCQVRRVRSNGEIKWQGRLFYVSELLAGEPIALQPHSDGLWQIFYRFQPLAWMNDKTHRIERLTQWREIPKPKRK